MTETKLYDETAFKTSKIVTISYSTSFSIAASLLEKKQRNAIYAIYGFVRIADEIVDTFHKHNKKQLLERFEKDLNEAIEQGISLNPVLHAFQKTVTEYNISREYIDAFLTSMKFDLEKKIYSCKTETDEYIYGSADVVGLMCLRIFCNGSDTKFKALKRPAMKLGSAFQKVNFLRDLGNDYQELGRCYFPNIDLSSFDETSKNQIIKEIKQDFKDAYSGIKKLPGKSRTAVLLAYLYYRVLLKKLERTSAKKLLHKRIRISNIKKIMLLVKAKTLSNLNMV
ncbi:phytoene/squalene synthase family protein [Maribellus maritimus]|uniref:phytoene/squalene synthase family protein n=1 Tax=Maribellus maritimus TaxID=2870838 RepID=UPI001EE9CA89|nr:phytoene/squalene synthase family protein [Maribellus maritimus]MCG6189197.1 phytoene/squalene synthase family protein [Maribellus maritimus]